MRRSLLAKDLSRTFEFMVHCQVRGQVLLQVLQSTAKHLFIQGMKKQKMREYVNSHNKITLKICTLMISSVLSYLIYLNPVVRSRKDGKENSYFGKDNWESDSTHTKIRHCPCPEEYYGRGSEIIRRWTTKTHLQLEIYITTLELTSKSNIASITSIRGGVHRTFMSCQRLSAIHFYGKDALGALLFPAPHLAF